MKLKLTSAIVTGVILFTLGCGSDKEKQPAETTQRQDNKSLLSEDPTTAAEDEKKGVGKFTKVELSPTLDKTMAEAGLVVYDMKCASCHKLTDEKIVGPGWKDVTKRRSAEWIMNFSTNTDEMLETDPAAITMLEECLIRMPNQNLSDADARSVYEFMRKNDGLN
jgi:cytochrome c551/c552